MTKNISEIFSEKRMASSPAKKKKKIHPQKHPCTKKTSPSRRLGRGRTGSQYSGSGAWLGLFALYLPAFVPVLRPIRWPIHRLTRRAAGSALRCIQPCLAGVLGLFCWPSLKSYNLNSISLARPKTALNQPF